MPTETIDLSGRLGVGGKPTRSGDVVAEGSALASNPLGVELRTRLTDKRTLSTPETKCIGAPE